MAPHLRRGGCDGLCARRAGCRRRRSGTAQRPSPAGSRHAGGYPDDTEPADRHLTARVADARVERLAAELRTAQAPDEEQPPSELQVALAALPESEPGATLLFAAWEGLTPKEIVPPVYQSRSPARGLSRLVRGSAAMSSWSWRRVPCIEVRNKPDKAHHVGPFPERTQAPAAGPEGEQMVYSTHIKRLSPQRARVLSAAALLSGALVAGCGGSSHSPTVATVGDATSLASTVAAAATTTARSTTSRAATSSSPSSPSGAPRRGAAGARHRRPEPRV
jgi:hypothetical protein